MLSRQSRQDKATSVGNKHTVQKECHRERPTRRGGERPLVAGQAAEAALESLGEICGETGAGAQAGGKGF